MNGISASAHQARARAGALETASTAGDTGPERSRPDRPRLALSTFVPLMVQDGPARIAQEGPADAHSRSGVR